VLWLEELGCDEARPRIFDHLGALRQVAEGVMGFLSICLGVLLLAFVLVAINDLVTSDRDKCLWAESWILEHGWRGVRQLRFLSTGFQLC